MKSIRTCNYTSLTIRKLEAELRREDFRIHYDMMDRYLQLIAACRLMIGYSVDI